MELCACRCNQEEIKAKENQAYHVLVLMMITYEDDATLDDNL